jgi:aspartate/methionine/tyrosine aminotransferase
MFASRLPARIDASPLARLISGLIAEARASGTGLLDLTESNPTRAGIIYPASEILAGLADPRALVYDPESLGLPEARERIAELHSVPVDRVILTASTSEAYSWLFKLLCDPGDEVLIPRPSYPLFDLLAALESVHVVPYPLRYHQGWFVDFDALRAALTSRTKAIVVVNPNNPTGSYLKESEQRTLEEICEERGIALISDEVFASYALAEGIARSAASERALSFVLNGLSKLVGMPQMKVGWIVLSGPDGLRKEAAHRLELIADTYLSVGTPVQYALPALLAAREPVHAQIMARLRRNLTYLRERVDGSSASVLDVEGGWYAILRVPRTRTEEQWVADLARDHGALVQPGYFYDFESEAYLVLSLLTPAGVFAEGVGRLVSVMQ